MALAEFIKIPYAYLKYGIVEKLGLLEKLEDLEEKLKLKELFYGFTIVQKARSIINDVVFRVSYIATSPLRIMPDVSTGFTIVPTQKGKVQ